MINEDTERIKSKVEEITSSLVSNGSALSILLSSVAGVQSKVKKIENELFGNSNEYSRKDNQPVLLCLLGKFHLLIGEKTVHLPGGGKSETLLGYLGLQSGEVVSRERLIQVVWPNNDLLHGSRSLNNLVYILNKLLAPALNTAPAVLHEDTYYRLNIEAGIKVDVTYFDHFVVVGNRFKESGNSTAAVAAYEQALELYRNDLYLIEDPQALMERERLRTSYLTLLSQMAEYNFNSGDYNRSLGYLWHLLARDSLREDAHRLVMRCYVRQGERTNALHQYQVCRDLLRTEFDATPEAATVALFDQIRNNPDSI